MWECGEGWNVVRVGVGKFYNSIIKLLSTSADPPLVPCMLHLWNIHFLGVMCFWNGKSNYRGDG